jgi:hypothetical protein
MVLAVALELLAVVLWVVAAVELADNPVDTADTADKLVALALVVAGQNRTHNRVEFPTAGRIDLCKENRHPAAEFV